MPRKGLRWLSTEQPPFCPECAMALLHTVILTKSRLWGFLVIASCSGKQTFASFACFASKPTFVATSA
jgi:hypothetical protein